MNNNLSHFSLYGKSPLTQLYASVLIILMFGMVIFYLLFLAGAQAFGVDPGNLTENLLTGTVNANSGFLRYMVISQTISFFIVPAIIISILLKPAAHIGLMNFKRPLISEVALVVILAFCTFPVTSFTGELNSVIHFPEWLSGVEQWMIEKENNADSMIGKLIVSDTFWIMMLNLLSIAVLPAIGEELIFRGIFQKILYRFFKSGHPSIWITAFLFSVLHFQFFGFLPRFILGLVFGYLFFWSRTLWLPVIAHFINNAVAVFQVYYKGNEYMNSQTDVTLWKQLVFLPLPLITGGLILWYFRKKSKIYTSADVKPPGINNT
jgi:uncharacterized protein